MQSDFSGGWGSGPSVWGNYRDLGFWGLGSIVTLE